MRHSAVDERSILAARGGKNRVDSRIPYAFLVEPEPTDEGAVEDVATIFLTNRECPFRCLFCDLWKNTTDETVPVGAIPEQIDYALARLPRARHVKLYNSGNFFDRRAIPAEDYAAIARRVSRFRTVIVENHPRLCGPACVEFRDLLGEAAQGQAAAEGRSDARPDAVDAPQLEVAIGLETVHPEVLSRLNKQMTLDDFRRAADFLRGERIALRAFILLKPPFLEEAACVDWALRSIEFAFDCGVRVCSVIPTRTGNGALENLQREGLFSPPGLRSLEAVLERGLALGRGRVLADVWDIERFSRCPKCGAARADRLRNMNLSQAILPAVECSCS